MSRKWKYCVGLLTDALMVQLIRSRLESRRLPYAIEDSYAHRDEVQHGARPSQPTEPNICIESTQLHETSRRALPRAVRIVQAFVVEVERRGYSVACVRVRPDAYGGSEWKPARDGQLTVTINNHALQVRIWERGSGLRGHYEEAM